VGWNSTDRFWRKGGVERGEPATVDYHHHHHRNHRSGNGSQDMDASRRISAGSLHPRRAVEKPLPCATKRLQSIVLKRPFRFPMMPAVLLFLSVKDSLR
ncbi:hypothetical protein cypCar_00041511, partial [Cyprinus carpio]